MDFREHRQKLAPGSFAIEPEIEPPASDLIDQSTWQSVTGLPDDVSLRTSDHHGTVIRCAHDSWGEWISLVLDIQGLCDDPMRDSLAVAAMNVTDELQVSVYLALTGFYRQAIGTLRAALEGMPAALHFSVVSDQAAIDEWLAGTDEGRLWVRKVRLKLSESEPFAQFEQQVNWPLFADGGWFAWLYETLSAFVHGRPAHTSKSGRRMETTNGGLWGSNGPIYHDGAFEFWARLYFNAILLSALLAGLAKPELTTLAKPSSLSLEAFLEQLFEYHPEPGVPRVAAVIAEHLFPIGQSVVR
jgi:hypothetical protein